MGRLLRSPLLMLVTVLAVAAGGPAWPSSIAKAQDPSVGPAPPLTLVPVVWSIVAEPIVPVEGTDRRIHLAYELLVTNVTGSTVQILAIEVVDPGEDDVVGANEVVAIDGQEVTGEVRLFTLPSTMQKANYSRLVPPGQSGIVYIGLTFASRRDVPERIAHRVTASQPDLEGAPEFTGVGAFAKISDAGAVVVRPPLRGDRWVDGDGCCTIIGPHRYTVLPISGTERVAEHFAIDFVRLDEEGRLFTGDPTVLESYSYYGADVRAAARGKVVEVVDDLPDQVPGELPPGITAAEASGNHVIVDIGDGRFTLYAHMIPGSIVVEPGQRVRAGQLLGHLGNSGNSSAPHLHFHVMSSPSPLNTVGLPFVFRDMDLQGRLVGPLGEVQDRLAAGEPVPIDDSGTGPRRRQMPLSKDVLGFR